MARPYGHKPADKDTEKPPDESPSAPQPDSDDSGKDRPVQFAGLAAITARLSARPAGHRRRAPNSLPDRHACGGRRVVHRFTSAATTAQNVYRDSCAMCLLGDVELA
jgi:hypothetical protein